MKSLSILFVLGFLTACSTSPSNTVKYYLLTPSKAVMNKVDSQKVNVKNNATMRLYIQNIHLPRYLQQPQLVMLKAQNQLHFSHYHLWAEDVEQSISKTLKQHLPVIWLNKAEPKAINLTIEIDDFYPTQQGKVIFRGRYWLQQQDTIIQQPFNYMASLNEAGFGNAIEQMHALVVLLARNINKQISH